MKERGKLYLIPSPLGESDFNKIFPPGNGEIIDSLDEFIVEDLRTARRFLRKVGFTKSFDNIIFHVLNEHSDKKEIGDFLNSNLQGKDIGLLSEAGLPCVADPGSNLVRLAHQKKIRIIPLTGPSSIFLALMASGFNGQNFAFVGYLPIENKARIKKIKQVEKDVYQKDQTQIFIETPYRNIQLFNALLKTCSVDTMLCIACDISTDMEFISTKSIKEWKQENPELHKRPAVFLLYR